MPSTRSRNAGLRERAQARQDSRPGLRCEHDYTIRRSPPKRPAPYMGIMATAPVRPIAVGFPGFEFIEVGVKALGRFLIPWRDPPDTRPQSNPISIGDCQRSEEHTSELQSLRHLVCRLLL